MNVRVTDGQLRVRVSNQQAYAAFPTTFHKVTTGAEAVGAWYCASKDTGFPGAWSVGTSGVNGRATDGTATADDGCLLVPSPSQGDLFLTSFTVHSEVNATVVLADILWVNDGLNVTTLTEQTFTTPAWPSRDVSGLSTGTGLWIGMLVTAALGNAAPITNCTIRYTNSAGTASRTATSSVPATPVVGTVVWFRMQAGDEGVTSIQGITNATSFVSGTYSLFVARPIVWTYAAPTGSYEGGTGGGMRLYNGSCLHPFYIATATTLTTLSGHLGLEAR